MSTPSDDTPTPEDAAPTQRLASSVRKTPDHAGRNPVRIVLAAIILGALAAAAVIAGVGGFDDDGAIASSPIGEKTRTPDANPFNRSVPGDCLTWSPSDTSHPRATDCNQPHYFEVAGTLDAAHLTYADIAPSTSARPSAGIKSLGSTPSGTAGLAAAPPSPSNAPRPAASASDRPSLNPSETESAQPFGKNSAWPSDGEFAAIRDRKCPAQVSTYLRGHFDPDGQYTVGMLYPSKRQWTVGDRTLRCGLQRNDAAGKPVEFSGRVTEANQSITWPAGTCVGIDPTSHQPTEAVDCGRPHAFQVTAVRGIARKFGAPAANPPWPSVANQDAYLTDQCTAATDAFFGGHQQYLDTTLNLQWSTISKPSWQAGTRSVVCYVGLPDAGGFATLVGDAKGAALQINGKAPVAPEKQPPGRLKPTPVPLPPGLAPNPTEVPAPVG